MAVPPWVAVPLGKFAEPHVIVEELFFLKTNVPEVKV